MHQILCGFFLYFFIALYPKCSREVGTWISPRVERLLFFDLSTLGSRWLKLKFHIMLTTYFLKIYEVNIFLEKTKNITEMLCCCADRNRVCVWVPLIWLVPKTMTFYSYRLLMTFGNDCSICATFPGSALVKGQWQCLITCVLFQRPTALESSRGARAAGQRMFPATPALYLPIQAFLHITAQQYHKLCKNSAKLTSFKSWRGLASPVFECHGGKNVTCQRKNLHNGSSHNGPLGINSLFHYH